MIFHVSQIKQNMSKMHYNIGSTKSLRTNKKTTQIRKYMCMDWHVQNMFLCPFSKLVTLEISLAWKP